MILEHAVLDVIPGEEERFETAFGTARPIIASAKGCRSVRLEHCLESPSRYLLLVEWETLEDHTEGFRGSPAYPGVATPVAPLLRPVSGRRALHHRAPGLRTAESRRASASASPTGRKTQPQRAATITTPDR